MGLLRRIFSLSKRSALDREIDAELQAHIAMRTDDNIAAGMTPEEASRDARIRFGNQSAMKERITAADTALVFSSFWADCKCALRQFVKNPGFACTAIVVLALGIGSSVAIFAFVDAALITPLPYDHPTQLVALFESNPFGPRYHLSYPDYLDWKKFNNVFSSLDVYDGTEVQSSGPSGTERIDGAAVSATFFRTLGVTPILGRDFQQTEDSPSAPATVLLSYAAWQKRFAGNLNILGQKISLDGAPHTIIGVLPREFHFVPTGSAEFWTTLRVSGPQDRGSHGLSAIARLKDGVQLQTAASNMSSIATQLAQQYPDADGGRGATVVPLREVIIGNLRPVLLVLLSGVALLLLIACVNVSSLLLVRSESRRREIALRGALGASTIRLICQLVTEALLLVAIADGLGLVTALAIIQMMMRLIPSNMLDNMPYLLGLGFNSHVVLFAIALSIAASFLISIIPILRLPVGDTRYGQTQGDRGSTGSVWRRFGSNLVILELATTMVLLVGACLLGKSFYRLLHTDLGMQPDNVASLRVISPHPNTATDAQVVTLEREIVSRVSRLPGVVSVGISHSIPIGPRGGITTFSVVGRPTPAQQSPVAAMREVSSGYFTTLRTRLLRGRYFTSGEDAQKPPVMIINATMARQTFPGEDPLGKHIIYDDSKPPVTIVGVVDDIKEGPLDESSAPLMYVPFEQQPDRVFFVLTRTSRAAQSVLPSISAVILNVDSEAMTSHGETMASRISDSYATYLHRASACLVAGFAALALMLSIVGLYGVTAYSVSQRTREIGVRMALGAQRSGVYQLIMKEAGKLTVIGIAFGMLCSVAAAVMMQSLLFGTAAWDAPTLAGVAFLLAICALSASYFPARRAASVNPVEALRAE
jgi:macrolide transport system ATP-binding/permease protein